METEDVSLAIVRFENGGVASVVNSVLSPRQTSYLRCDFADVPSSHEAQRRALVALYRTGERPAASDADGRRAARPPLPRQHERESNRWVTSSTPAAPW